MIARFIAGLRIPIQDRVSVLCTYSLADSMNRASQIEKQLARSARISPFKPANLFNSPAAQATPDNGKGLLGERPKVASDPYTWPPLICYKCSQPEH